ncbi:MAG: thioredoxin family protein [Anaerolineales bacterium]
MARLGYIVSLLVILSLACSTLSAPPTATAIPPSVSTSVQQSVPTLPNSDIVDFYDPLRNPANDLAQAIPVAQAENKRIMLELGGDWCIWCKYMDDFYATHPDILQYRMDHYILIKVNVSEENANEGFLSQYPAVDGYPHIFILENTGKLLQSQDTAELEDGEKSYVPEVFMSFLEKWALPSQ